MQDILISAVQQGYLGLIDYLSAHVLFCLIPALFIAGAVNSLLAADAILKYLGSKSKKVVAYGIASISGLLVQVCSCTIIPLFAGIWKRGAGLGVAITFLYAGPAVNLLSLVLTGQRLGWDFALVRFVLSIVFAIGVGLIMQAVFGNGHKDEQELIVAKKKNALSGAKAKYFWLSLLGVLIIGSAPITDVVKIPSVLGLTIIQLLMTYKWLSVESRRAWWSETMKFFKQILPLLFVGVFLASALTSLIPQDQFQALTSQNNLLTNLLAVLFGALAYFPALVEVPIAENFMKLGMHRGPLMAYLLADPVLSLQGLLIIGKFIGAKKTSLYVLLIMLLTTFAGYFYGLI
jgi:uncharacterized protein